MNVSDMNYCEDVCVQGAAKKVASPLMVFANFSAVVPEFKVKFGTFVSSSNLHLTAKYHLISF